MKRRRISLMALTVMALGTARGAVAEEGLRLPIRGRSQASLPRPRH
ncbi:hypothetical protein LJK87_14275 [Paenibacillus sp. P25]|nr:hypothetical protein LJK87_14275 [Paenibacillus sp. P25]